MNYEKLHDGMTSFAEKPYVFPEYLEDLSLALSWKERVFSSTRLLRGWLSSDESKRLFYKVVAN
tara:strand:- start:55 stop:246 length:192 start_codon:yes stop_codon:yes gene_type:complete